MRSLNWLPSSGSAFGAPEDPEGVAAVMAFLARDDARLVTGVNMPVDAGLSASNGQSPM